MQTKSPMRAPAVVLLALVVGSTLQVAMAQTAPQKSSAPIDADELVVKASFISPGAKSALKLDADIRDTPFSVSNYSGDFMKAIETTNLADLYNYMTGIARGGVTGFDLSIRGFKTTANDKNAILVDGLPGLAGRFGSPPTVGIENIEVVKGPASVLYGLAQPGGFVNIIAKKPKPAAAVVADVRISGFSSGVRKLSDGNGRNLSLDATGPVDDDKRLLVRVIGELTDRDLFRDRTWERAEYIVPSARWYLTDRTIIAASWEFRYRKNAYDNLLVAPNKDVNLIAKITTRYQEPGDWQEETGNAITLTATHTFQNDAVWNFGYRNVRNLDDAVGYDTVGVLADLRTLQRRARNQHNERMYGYYDTNFTIPFKTGPVEHNAIVGLSGGSDVTDFERIQFFNGPTSGALSRPGPTSINIDIYNPIYGVAPPLSSFPVGTVNRRWTKSSSRGFYFSNLITFTEQWKASVGIRNSAESQRAEERKTPPFTVQLKDATATVPSAGLLFQPTRQWTIYTSYAEGFNPTVATAQDRTGLNPFVPEKSKQIEAGLKGELLQGRLNTTFALFDIQRRNTLAPIACNTGVAGTCSQQVGGERSKGFEIELNYRPIKNWQIAAGIARADAKIETSTANATSPLVGARLTNAPLNNANFWSRYNFTAGTLKGFGIGLGLVYRSEHTGSLPSTADRRVLLLPAYTVADLGIYYKLGRADFTLRIGNLADKVYFEGVNSTTNELGVVPGLPRNVALSVRVPL